MFSLIVTAIGNVPIEENVVVTETRSVENADALVLEKGADVPGLVSERGRLWFQQRKLWAAADVGTGKEKEVLLGIVEKGVGTGIERETARGEAEAGTKRETGREGREQMEGKKALVGKLKA